MRIGTWGKTIKKFPTTTLKRIIIKVWYYLPVSYESIDWGIEFEDLHDHDTLEDFIDVVIARGGLKRDYRGSEYNQCLYKLEEQASALDLCLLTVKKRKNYKW